MDEKNRSLRNWKTEEHRKDRLRIGCVKDRTRRITEKLKEEKKR